MKFPQYTPLPRRKTEKEQINWDIAKQIPEFSKYAIDINGTVWNLETMRKLKPSKQGKVVLCSNGKSKAVQVINLLATMFLENPYGYKFATLKNPSLPLSADNIKWGRTPNATIPIKCVENDFKFESIAAAAKWCDISESTIRVALNKKNLTAGGFHWVKIK